MLKYIFYEVYLTQAWGSWRGQSAAWVWHWAGVHWPLCGGWPWWRRWHSWCNAMTWCQGHTCHRHQCVDAQTQPLLGCGIGQPAAETVVLIYWYNDTDTVNNYDTWHKYDQHIWHNRSNTWAMMTALRDNTYDTITQPTCWRMKKNAVYLIIID